MALAQTDSPDELFDLRILIIDDDIKLCELIGRYLKSRGFQVEAVHDGRMGVKRALSGAYSLILLDVLLPGIGGLEVLRRIRAKAAVPIVMLSAHGDDIDPIVGLEIGADDYLPKPFNPRELAARIHAVLRRSVAGTPRGTSAPISILLDDIRLDIRARVARHKARDVELTAAEFELLSLFFRAPGQVISRKDLVRGALRRDTDRADRSLDVHISSLRKKLGPRPDGRGRIRAIRNVGYFYVVSGTSR
jgi:two-component system, OmpR family, response regulator CpxR